MASDSSREYRILVAPQARRQLAKLPREIRGRIGRRIEELAANPRPRNTIKLEGEEDLYRNRVGEYRIIYGIRDEELIVLVLEVGHRREVYRD